MARAYYMAAACLTSSWFCAQEQWKMTIKSVLQDIFDSEELKTTS